MIFLLEFRFILVHFIPTFYVLTFVKVSFLHSTDVCIRYHHRCLMNLIGLVWMAFKSSFNLTLVNTSNLELVLIAHPHYLTTQSLKSVQSGQCVVVRQESLHLEGFSHLNYRSCCSRHSGFSNSKALPSNSFNISNFQVCVYACRGAYLYIAVECSFLNLHLCNILLNSGHRLCEMLRK